MALPTSPPISLRQISDEFNAWGIVSITDFYRGGGYVPNIPQNSGIPTSGAISLLDFLGATNTVPLSGNLSQLHGEYVNPTMPLPIPAFRTVTANPRANPTGGSGSYSYSWNITSGLASITSGASSQQCTISASVPNHSQLTGGIRCIVNDGSTSVTLTGTYSLYYSGGTPV